MEIRLLDQGGFSCYHHEFSQNCLRRVYDNLSTYHVQIDPQRSLEKRV